MSSNNEQRMIVRKAWRGRYRGHAFEIDASGAKSRRAPRLYWVLRVGGQTETGAVIAEGNARRKKEARRMIRALVDAYEAGRKAEEIPF